MEDVRQLVQEEGREARNLLAFHVAVDSPAPRVSRKPPRALAPRRAPRAAARLRSASAGRDKRSELRARYWALLFGDLQRAIGEIYNTVEAHENLNECQEVILVLENYTRDFKALGEWFRLKWEYDNTPPPQRPQSLAWEIRKTDFVRPESRKAFSVRSSPSVSGKNSPSLSGYTTPSGKISPVPGKASPGSGKISPRIGNNALNSPKGNIEFFSNKVASKIATKPEAKSGKDGRLFDIKEKEVMTASDNNDKCSKESVRNEKCELKQEKMESKQYPVVEIGKAKESPNVNPNKVVIKSSKSKTSQERVKKPAEEISSQAKATSAQLDAMENEFLAKNLIENSVRNDNNLNLDSDLEKCSANDQNGDIEVINVNASTKSPENSPNQGEIKNGETSISVAKEESQIAGKNQDIHTESPTKSEDNFADVSNGSSRNEEQVTDVDNSNATEDSKIEVPVSKNTEEPMISKDPSEINLETDQKENTEQGSKRNKTLKDTEVETKGKSSNGKCASAKVEAAQEKEEKMDNQKQDTKLNTEVRPTDVKPSRPAYSQAAAKPKQILTKPEVKTVVRTTTPIVRSKTVVEIPPNTTTSKPRPYLKRAQNQTNKCSYPFNLTTGRNTLFDTATNSGKVVRKTLQKPSQVSSGDNKQATNKVDAKKRPPRPASLKINEKGDKKETNAATEKLKDCDEYSSTDTLVTQIDMSRIESSESLKTLVPEDMMEDVANSVEVLNLDGTKNDNEGWLTVKSRRLSRESKKQSKSHWANRFNQPSATTSLPTLNTLSPKQETNPITESATEKLDRAKSEQPETLTKAVKAVKVAVKSSKVDKYKDPAMIRQKSDVTGLKTRSARSRANKKEKLKDLVKTDGELSKNRLHSSLESLTTGLARSQESTEDSFDFDKWKVQFKSTFKYLDEEDQDQIPNHNEILRTADPSEMSEIQEMTSQIEENEKKISWALDFQSEVDTRKLCEEEDLLNRQIMELQQVSDVELDTETDDTETDAEILIEDHLPPVPCQSPDSMNLGSLAASLEDQYETALAGMSWAERVDTLVVLEALVARDPGRAQQLHAKLSQGISRRGSLQDALRRLQAKQARAERQRAHYRTERAKRIHQLLSRVEEVKIAKNQLIEEKRLRMERRLQKAAENRDQHLKDIVRKAHDEEEKLREIAFIKQLELENKRHEFLDQCRSHTTRLRQMRRQRLNKLEQKAAREAAVGARRQAIEAARKLHVETLLERRKERDARVEELKELKKQERDDAAREKAEGVKSRLSALAAAAELEADALRSRIRDKQDASQQRLESHLQAIREKATCPRQATTSESHDQEKELQEETERVEQERREKEKQKTVKKRARKVKQKLLATSIETSVIDENNTLDPMQPLANKLYKVINQLSNLLAPLLDSENDLSSKKGSYNSENDIERNNRKNSHTKINGDDDKSLKDAEVLVKKSLHEEVNDKKNIQIKLDSDERTLKDTEVTEKKKSKKNKRESTPKLEKVVSNTDAEDIKKDTIKNQNHEEKKPSKTENKKKSNKEKKPNANSPDLQICSNKQTSIKQAEIKIVDQIDKNELIPKIKAQNKVDIIITEEPKIESTDNPTTKLTDEPEAKTESSKKRNKKNRNNSLTNKDLSLDRPKLSKTSSLCSSLSDMSKASCKSDRKSRTLIDTTLLDRNLNELHRMAEKFDMTPNDLSSAILPQKIHLLKTIGQLLTVAAEREDLTVQLSAKSLTTAVTTVSRLISACQASASYFLTSNLCVHVVKLLSNQLEKDLQDPKESDLAKQLSNCLSIALDSIRYSMRVKEKEGDKADSKGDLGLLRSRAHTLISYICLCGCVSRAEVADDARDSVCTLLTLCADLCLPWDADVGTERASAIQSLRCALNKSLCGARAQLCMFYASQEPERTVFAKAAGTAKMLRAVAELDHHLVQEAFGEGGWPLEFRAAVARLLTQHAPDDKAARSACDGHGQKVDQKSEEALVLDLIVLIGFVVVNNPQLQETISEGCSVVKTLCTLPANWLLTKPHCHILLPTLVALADSPFASSAIAGELSMQMLEEYMESSEAQTVKLVQVIKQGKAKKANKK